MNHATRTIRLMSAIAAVAITSCLFQGVTSLSRPTAIEQVALAKKSTVTVASVGAPTATAQRPTAR